MSGMNAIARTRCWIKKHNGFMCGCEYDEDHVWVGTAYIADFQIFIKGHFYGDYMNIPCTLQENSICFKWEDLKKFI